MIQLIGIELRKIFSKWRTYIAFLAITLLIFIIQISFFVGGKQYIHALTQNLKGLFYITGNLLNGYLIGNLILNGLFVQIPFLIVLVGGDLLAGEATAGTYRMLLTRPVSRTKVIFSKFIAGNIYVFLFLVWLAIVSLGLSLVIFGSGDLILFSNGITIISANDILWRFCGAYAVAYIGMSTVFTLSFLFSSLVENALGPLVATMSVIIIFFGLSIVDIDFLRQIRPYLFTSHLNIWTEFFNDPVDYSEVFKSSAILLGHTVVFLGASLYIFNKKDILS